MSKEAWSKKQRQHDVCEFPGAAPPLPAGGVCVFVFCCCVVVGLGYFMVFRLKKRIVFFAQRRVGLPKSPGKLSKFFLFLVLLVLLFQSFLFSLLFSFVCCGFLFFCVFCVCVVLVFGMNDF